MQFIDSYKFNTTTKILSIFVCVFSCLLLIPTVKAQKKQYVVVLDAGHGGHDPGKVGYKRVKEKEIALKIVLQIGKLLKPKKDIKVVYTRKKDVFVDLLERGNIANDAKADIFISVHCNAHSTQALGTETWVLGLHANRKNFEVAKQENSVILLEDNYKEKYKGFDPNSPESVIGLTLLQEENLDKSLKLASSVQRNLTSKLKRKNRGVKQAGFVVLYQTTMPSILIETGFITNKHESHFLGSIKGQLQISTQIANAIKKYIVQLKLNTVQEKKDIQEKKQVIKEVLFKVQIASGRNKIALKSYNFKGLKNVERIKTGSTYKYYYSISSDYNTTKKGLFLAKSKGYTTAFIIAFKDGERIALLKALKLP